MKLFQDSRGFIISFGFDVELGSPNPRMIAWSDFGNPVWAATSANQAGKCVQRFDVVPQFVHECDGRVIAYQPGRCIEMTYIGGPFVWSIKVMQPDEPVAQAA